MARVTARHRHLLARENSTPATLGVDHLGIWQAQQQPGREIIVTAIHGVMPCFDIGRTSILCCYRSVRHEIVNLCAFASTTKCPVLS